MTREIWKDIEGYEGLYQVSNFGRVKRVVTNRILKQAKQHGGSMLVRLSKNGKPHTCTVHRLAAQAFIPNPENKPQVNHIDEDKTNNMIPNLEWVTAKENINHGTRNERTSKKVKAIDIANGEWNEYYSTHECARQLDLNQGSIVSCLKGRLKQTGGYVFEYAK
jgi:hypothetical protein